MDERQRFLERVFSREGAAELPEDHRDPVTGATVRMTPSQWALAEYDRLHAHQGQDALEEAAVPGEQADAGACDAGDGIRMREASESTGAHDDDRPASGSGSWPESRWRRPLPYLAAVGAFLLGVALTVGVDAATRPGSGSTVAGSSSGVGALTPAPGDGDEAATLVTIARYFESTPRAHGLSAGTAQGFDVTSFHLVTGAAIMNGTAIYAARRLDGEYCLVAVTDAGRAAETCGTMDDIARRGLRLTADAAPDAQGNAVAVTVTWETDGTISTDAAPSIDG